MQLISSSKQKARKQHTCDWCELTIEAGTVYERQVFKDDEIFVWKNHISCAEIAHKLGMFDPYGDEGLGSNDFQEQITEEYKNLMILADESFSVLPPFKHQLEYVVAHHLKI